jgi:hypothetical protein
MKKIKWSRLLVKMDVTFCLSTKTESGGHSIGTDQLKKDKMQKGTGKSE